MTVKAEEPPVAADVRLLFGLCGPCARVSRGADLIVRAAIRISMQFEAIRSPKKIIAALPPLTSRSNCLPPATKACLVQPQLVAASRLDLTLRAPLLRQKDESLIG